MSDPVETKFGWHLIRLVQRAPARHTSIAEAADELRAGVYEPWRAHQLDLYVQGLVERYGPVVHPERLDPPESP